jgi:general secretion pathway protein E
MLYRGKGCRQCFHTGYRGRSVVSELLDMTEDIRRLVISRSPSVEIFRGAVAQGMQTMYEDGIQKVLRGVTTLEEVLEVTEDAE